MISWIKKEWEERRRSKRFEVAVGAPKVPVTIERRNAHATPGELVDLSQQGAKLCLESVLQFSEEVVLRLVLPEQEVSLAIESKIAWTRATSDGQFFVGCSFESAVPDAVIDRLAAVGLLDRRRHPRYSIELPATAKWQLNTDPMPTTLLDYSAGGFRMQCDAAVTRNQRVRVEFETEEHVFGVVKWCAATETGFECGCEFLHLSPSVNSAEIVRRLAEAQLTNATTG